MARIRSVKPEFFRHEQLQALEVENPGAYCMLTFQGLWIICDRAGRFGWKPRTIHLDVLPFIEYDIDRTMHLLADAGFIQRYEVQGKVYGHIPSWLDHQTFESLKNERVRFPSPDGFFPDKSGKDTGQVRDEFGINQGRVREGKGKGMGSSKEPVPGDAEIYTGTSTRLGAAV
jgi:hypothetical protein